MDRLTKFSPTKNCYVSATGCFPEIVTRLAAYEDTWLEPEEVSTTKAELALYVDAFNGVKFERIMEIARAEKAGRLVVLPCKVGDAVYVPMRDGIHRAIVKGIRMSGSMKDTVLHLDIENGRFRWGSGKGKTWFATRQEAEEALREEAEHG